MAKQRTPFEEGFRLPPEWAQHSGCLISWPNKEETWMGYSENTKQAYKEVIKSINQFEPVIVLSDHSTIREARNSIESDIEILEIPLDDAWVRDNGPIFVVSEDNRVAMIHFGFNGWGDRYPPYEKDAQVPIHLADHFKMRRYRAPMILEGGSICVDGEGTLLTTESCLLNSNRNPELTREDIEDVLRSYLNAKKVLWVEQGLHGSSIDGHIDGIAAFVRPATVILAATKDKSDPNHLIMKKNRERLESLTDAKDRSIEIIDFPMPTTRQLEGYRVASCYTNFYIANGGIVAPIFGEPNDKIALEILRDLFPNNEVISVRSEYIGIGGGCIHCITQQLPTGNSVFP